MNMTQYLNPTPSHGEWPQQTREYQISSPISPVPKFIVRVEEVLIRNLLIKNRSLFRSIDKIGKQGLIFPCTTLVLLGLVSLSKNAHNFTLSKQQLRMFRRHTWWKRHNFIWFREVSANGKAHYRKQDLMQQMTWKNYSVTMYSWL